MSGNRLNELVTVGPSAIHGRGLFAATTLESGQLIGVYDGPVVEENDSHVLWIEDDSGTGWIGYDGENELRFMNHSDQPNAEMDGLHCYSVRKILPGDEITIDYGWNDS